jgi:hypothetical protein
MTMIEFAKADLGWHVTDGPVVVEAMRVNTVLPRRAHRRHTRTVALRCPNPNSVVAYR